MKLLLTLDEANGKNSEIKTRKAARAIIFIGDKLLLIQSDKYHECKFPGGGMKENEVLKQTLIREVLEETGLDVIPESIKEYGKVIEKHIDLYDKEKVFENISYYFLCNCVDNHKKTNMDDYEIEYGYHTRIMSIDEAITQNIISEKNGPAWVKREIEVLKKLKLSFEL